MFAPPVATSNIQFKNVPHFVVFGPPAAKSCYGPGLWAFITKVCWSLLYAVLLNGASASWS